VPLLLIQSPQGKMTNLAMRLFSLRARLRTAMSSSWVLLLSVLAKQHWLMLTWAKVVLIAVSLLCVILYLHSSGLLFVQLAVVGSLARWRLAVLRGWLLGGSQ